MMCSDTLQCVDQIGVGSKALSMPGGYCTRLCGFACPLGSVCVFLDGAALCAELCPQNGCRVGYSCCDVGPDKVCAPSNACQGPAGTQD
jgi:hypothetical protein